ncbi:MAG: hypothetical protein Unbinned3891contig1000_48 [Prokaryotic dsDNA virus sp.]|nr:MAG: hypothetical protein Unbinned3891contig1000_48 [Prokaryotic dsDNA virus sp.]
MADQILEEYAEQGYDLTLRQLYYQFVARGYIPNKQSEYHKLGTIVNKARMAGYLRWDRIVDRTRNLQRLPTWSGPEGVVDTAARMYRRDLWKNQERYVEVWIEKEALVGVIEEMCDRHRVPYFACRGYVSQSEMWSAAQRIMDTGKPTTILHLGDHDPSGIDMSRDIIDRLGTFTRWRPDIRLTVNRLALNMDQIDYFNPPPNPAKLTDSRCEGYIAQYGEQSWELDAVSPKEMNELLRREISRLVDMKAWRKDDMQEEKDRAVLQWVSNNWDTVAEMVE